MWTTIFPRSDGDRVIPLIKLIRSVSHSIKKTVRRWEFMTIGQKFATLEIQLLNSREHTIGSLVEHQFVCCRWTTSSALKKPQCHFRFSSLETRHPTHLRLLCWFKISNKAKLTPSNLLLCWILKMNNYILLMLVCSLYRMRLFVIPLTGV